MLKKQAIDFHYIDPKHAEIHGRLENWSRWCGKGNRYVVGVTPMFRLYAPAEHWDGEEPSIPIDGIDAQKIAKGVTALPEQHRQSLSWYYVTPCSPGKAARAIGTSLQGLATYVVHARTMLVNRGV